MGFELDSKWRRDLSLTGRSRCQSHWGAAACSTGGPTRRTTQRLNSTACSRSTILAFSFIGRAKERCVWSLPYFICTLFVFARISWEAQNRFYNNYMTTYEYSATLHQLIKSLPCMLVEVDVQIKTGTFVFYNYCVRSIYRYLSIVRLPVG